MGTGVSATQRALAVHGESGNVTLSTLAKALKALNATLDLTFYDAD